MSLVMAFLLVAIWRWRSDGGTTWKVKRYDLDSIAYPDVWPHTLPGSICHVCVGLLDECCPYVNVGPFV